MSDTTTDATTIDREKVLDFQEDFDVTDTQHLLAVEVDSNGKPKDNKALYFVHYYRSCERGTSENPNGIIRRFLPQDMDFALIKKASAREEQDLMNSYSRCILGGKTPLHGFQGGIT